MNTEKDTRVLIVEDESLVGEMIQGILESMNYSVAGRAIDGKQAIEMTRALHPDIILMDMQLPKISGLDATKQIREHPEFTEIPILALTAYAMKGDEEKYIEAGCTAYMSKPVNTRELPVKVAELLGE